MKIGHAIVQSQLMINVGGSSHPTLARHLQRKITAVAKRDSTNGLTKKIVDLTEIALRLM